MLSRTLLAIVILISLYHTSIANNEPRPIIKGMVIDAETKEPLVGVNVYLRGTTLGAASEVDGSFIITNVPVGDIEVVATMVGYNPEVSRLIIKKNGVHEINLQLGLGLLETGTVVVTGTLTPYLYKEAPVKTEVISKELITKTSSVNFADALSLQTGVRVENDCQNCNFTQVRILGYDGKYSQILIDGDPVVSTLAGVYALEQFPEEMIDQIEIVKGGGSALYGGGAIAGTINLRTRRPAFNVTRLNYQGQSSNGVFDNKVGVTSEFVNDDGKTGAFIYASTRKRDAYDRNNDGFSELGSLSNLAFGANWFYRPINNSELEISFHRINEERRGGNDFDLPQHEADIAEWVNHVKWGGKAKWNQRISNEFSYKVYYSFSSLVRDSYYGGLAGDSDADRLEALNYYGNTDNFTFITGTHANFNIGINKFTAGLEYFNDNLRDKSVKDKRYHIDETYENIGFFLHDDIVFDDNGFNLIVGTRFDKHSELSKIIISPRLNIKYRIGHDLYLRGSLTTGFKAPQTFDEDLHIESLGGDQRVVRNTADLKEEKNITFSLGLEFQEFVGNMPLLLGITAFYSNLTNAFSEVESDDQVENLVLWDRINSDGATIKGIELDFGLRPVNEIELRGGLTIKKNEYDSEQEIFDGIFFNKFLRTPDLFGHLRVSYDISEKFNLFTSLKFTGSMYVPNERIEEVTKTKKSFYDVDLGLTYRIPFLKDFVTKINFGVKNILNTYQEDLETGVNRDPGYLYGPIQPRRVYFGIDTSF